MRKPRKGRQSKLPSFQELIFHTADFLYPDLIYRPCIQSRGMCNGVILNSLVQDKLRKDIMKGKTLFIIENVI